MALAPFATGRCLQPTVVTRPATGAELLTGVSLLDVPDAAHIAAAIQAILRDRTIQQESSDAARFSSSI